MRARLAAPPGGVMTEEVGAVTGDLEVWLADDRVRVAYAGARDEYTVTGPPVPDGTTVAEVVAHLAATPPPDEVGNAVATDVRALAAGGRSTRS